MKLYIKTLLIMLLTLCHFSACASAKVDLDIQHYDSEVLKLKTDFQSTPEDLNNKTWIKSKIDNMFTIDQYMRSYWDTPFKNNYTISETDAFKKIFTPKAADVDLQNTQDLKNILKIYTWLKISEFGEKTDKQAWLVVQHADQDSAFQEEILKILTTLWPIKETNPANYAYLYDRVAASYSDPSKRKLQRYGTQGLCAGPGIWEPLPMEDPNHIDEIRKTVGLGTMEIYKKLFKDICH